MYVYKKRRGIAGVNGQRLFMTIIEPYRPAFEQFPPGLELLKAPKGQVFAE